MDLTTNIIVAKIENNKIIHPIIPTPPPVYKQTFQLAFKLNAFNICFERSLITSQNNITKNIKDIITSKRFNLKITTTKLGKKKKRKKGRTKNNQCFITNIVCPEFED